MAQSESQPTMREATRPSLMPADTPDYMAPAWASCMSWAISKDEIRKAFEDETGQRYSPPKNPIDAAIDEATGHGKAYIEAFVQWANVAVWGTIDA